MRDLPSWLEARFPFRRRRLRIGEYRIHFVDEGEGRPVLLLHGNPTWSFLWRGVLARLEGRGLRLVAPDLVGFGFSDKPREVGAHSLERHVEWIGGLVRDLDLGELTIVGQDWGGPIAAGVAAREPGRVRAAVFGNTSLGPPRDPRRATRFHRASHLPVVSDLLFRIGGFPLGVLHRAQGDPASLGPVERRAYRFPLRRWRDRAGPLALARMVPNRPGHPSLALLEEGERWARSFEGPVELVWGLADPILGRALRRMRDVFPRARTTETAAGHFLQEEVPDELAAAVVRVSTR